MVAVVVGPDTVPLAEGDGDGDGEVAVGPVRLYEGIALYASISSHAVLPIHAASSYFAA